MATTIAETTEPATRDELVECLQHLADDAKRERRRGQVGIRGARYADLHRKIDARLVQLEVYGLRG